MAIELGHALDLRKFPGIGANSSNQTILDLKGKQVTEDLDVQLVSDKSKDVAAAHDALGHNKKKLLER